MTLYGNGVSATRPRLLAIGAATLFAGLVAFMIGYSATSRIDVIGYMDIARIIQTDAEGRSAAELVVSPIVLAGQINSGAFFDAAAAQDPLRRARIIARVPPRADYLELSTRVDSADEGIRIVGEIVQRIAAAHRAQQQPTLERLQKRVGMLQAQLDELLKTRNQLDRMFVEAAGSKAGDTMRNFFLLSLRAQSNKEIGDLERERESTADAVRQMQERQTRLVGNVMPHRASILVPLAIGIFGAIFGALLATAAVFGLAYRRAARGS